MATLLLTLVRIVGTGEWVTPLVVVAVTLAVIWAGEDYLDPVQERVALTLAILAQVALYANHLGGLVAWALGLGGILYVWRRHLGEWWRRDAGPAVAHGVRVPDEVAETATTGARSVGGRMRAAVELVKQGGATSSKARRTRRT